MNVVWFLCARVVVTLAKCTVAAKQRPCNNMLKFLQLLRIRLLLKICNDCSGASCLQERSLLDQHMGTLAAALSSAGRPACASEDTGEVQAAVSALRQSSDSQVAAAQAKHNGVQSKLTAKQAEVGALVRQLKKVCNCARPSVQQACTAGTRLLMPALPMLQLFDRPEQCADQKSLTAIMPAYHAGPACRASRRQPA